MTQRIRTVRGEAGEMFTPVFPIVAPCPGPAREGNAGSRAQVFSNVFPVRGTEASDKRSERNDGTTNGSKRRRRRAAARTAAHR